MKKRKAVKRTSLRSSPRNGVKGKAAKKRPPSLSLPHKGGGNARATRAAKAAATVTAPEIALVKPKGLPARPVNTRWPKEIKVGPRFRKDMGDLKADAAWIDYADALLHPVPITPAGRLIAGERRLAMWPLTKFKDRPIPVTVIAIKDVRKGEAAENFGRRDFKPSEAVAIKRALEPALKADAQARVKAHGGTTHGRKAGDVARKGRVGEQLAMFTGVSRTTLDKAERIMQAAEAHPKDARFQKLKADMDRSGKVNGPFKRLEIMQAAEALRNAPPPAPLKGPYGVAAIDFPWAHEDDMPQDQIEARGRSLRPYPPLSIEAGVKLFREKIAPLLADPCTVYFWVTNHHLLKAQHIPLLQALGFDIWSTMATWAKDKFGRGQILRDQTEHCIVVTRGKPTIDIGNLSTLWQGEGWERRENSRKPEAFYRLVEAHSPAARYLEVFSTGGVGEKWDCWGDQAGKHAGGKGGARIPPAAARAAEQALPAEAKAGKGKAGKGKPRPSIDDKIAAVPALGVVCPTCEAKRGSWCKRPSGHKAMDLHAGRVKAAAASPLIPAQAGIQPAEVAAVPDDSGSPLSRGRAENEARPVRRTLPGRDADLLGFAKAFGHVVDQTIDVDAGAAVAECACGWRHVEQVAPPADPASRRAAAKAFDDAITAHWKAAREATDAEIARGAGGDQTTDVSGVSRAASQKGEARLALEEGSGVAGAASAAPLEGAGSPLSRGRTEDEARPRRLQRTGHWSAHALDRASRGVNGLPGRFVGQGTIFHNPYDDQPLGGASAAARVQLYRDMLADGTSEKARIVLKRLPELKGRNLYTDAAEDEPSHADVLLELANAPDAAAAAVGPQTEIPGFLRRPQQPTTEAAE